MTLNRRDRTVITAQDGARRHGGSAKLVGIAKAGFLGGIGFIATPVMALTIPVADASALLLPLLIIIDLPAVRHCYRTYDKASIRIIFSSGIIGIMLGAAFFGAFRTNETMLRAGIGILSLAFLTYQAGRKLLFGALENGRSPKIVSVGQRVLAGFASMLARARGPLASVYLLPQGLARSIFVGTSVMFFTAVNLIELVPNSALGLLPTGNVSTILILAPLSFVGLQLGLYLNRRFTDV